MTLKVLVLGLLRALLLGVVFGASVVVALALHANLPAGRRAIGFAFEHLLNGTFTGSFAIGGIDSVSGSGLSAHDVVVSDEAGRAVLSVAELRAHADIPAILQAVLLGKGPIAIGIERVEVTRADALLVATSDATAPSLVRAFTLRPTPGASQGAPARPVRVVLPKIELARGFVRGSLFGERTFELDVKAVEGAVRVAPERTTVLVRDFSTVVRGLGGADIQGTTSFRLRTPDVLRATFSGKFGDVDLSAVVRLDEGQVRATFDIPKASPEAVRALFADYPLHEDVNVAIEGSGKFPILALRGSVRAGDGRLLFTGPVRVDARAGAELEVDGKNVDLRVALPDAPPTRLDFLAQVRVFATQGGAPSSTAEPSVQVDARTKPTVILGTELPAMDVHAGVQGGEATGSALLREPGFPAHTRFKLEKSGRVTLSAQATDVRLERVPRLAALLEARGHGDVALDASIEHGKITGNVRAELADAETGELALGAARLSGRFSGSVDRLDALELDGELASQNLRVGGLSFESAAARISGPAREPRVDARLSSAAGPSVTAEARVGAHADGVRVSALTIALGRDQTELMARARALDLRDGTLDLQELELAGLGGSLKGSLQVSPERVRLNAQGRGLNLATLSRLLGLSTRPRGVVDLDADIELARDIERGTVQLKLGDVAVGPVDGLSAELNAELAQGALNANLEAELAEVGPLEGTLHGTLAGSALEPSAYRDMTGDLELSLPEADLALLGGALKAAGLIDGLSGKLSTRVRLSRARAGALPNVHVAGYTDSVAVELPQSALPDLGSQRTLSGLDVTFSGQYAAETGESVLSARLIDKRGALAEGQVRATLDLPALYRAPERFKDLPLSAKFLLGERAFDALPPVIQPRGARGLIRAEATLEGPLSAPKLSGLVSLGDFELTGPETPRPIDLCATVTYEPVISHVESAGEAFLSRGAGTQCAGERVLRYALMGSVGRGAEGIVPRGTATLGLEGFPLDALPGVTEAGVSGRAFGSVSVTDHDGTPELAASLELRDTTVQGVAVGTGKLRVQSDVRSVGATLALSSSGGEIKGSALAALDRSHGLPRLDTKQPMFLRMTAKRADAVLLAPLVKDVLSEIGGRVDADLSATLVSQPSKEDPDKLAGSIQGYAKLAKGAVQLSGLGLRLNDISLEAHADSVDSLTRIRLTELSGIGGRSKDRVRVTNGELWLDGVNIVRASGNLIPEELPLLVEGVQQATARTRQPIPFRVERQPNQMLAVVDIPYLDVALLQSSGRDVIELDENDSILVEQPLGEPTRPSSDGLPWRVRVELGRDVRLTRSDLELPITGKAEALIADELAVSGDLELSPGGRLRISDNTFVIESGEVHFNTGDPANPSLRVTATWRAPDDTLVFLTVTGTLKNPRLEDPTSSPPKSKQEIWALLMGYSSGGNDDSSGPGAASALVGAQQLLSPFFQNTVVQKISFRANESEKAERSYTTYTAAIPIGDKLWFEGSYHAPSSSPTQTNQPKGAVSGTVDWRFRPHWSLRTEVGTIGTGLDLFWQYRY